MKNLIWLTLALGFAACGHDQLPGSNGGDGADSTGSTLPDSLTKAIGPEGGVLKIRGVTLTVPKDALRKSTELTLSNLGDKAVSELPAPALGFSRAARPTAFEPHGQMFEIPVEIEMVADSNPKSVTVQRLDDTKDMTWESIALVTDNLPQVKFGTRTFSIYSLFSGQATDLPSGSGGLAGVGGSTSAGGKSSAGGAAAASGGSMSVGGGSGGSIGLGGAGSVEPMSAYFDDGTWRGYWFEVQPSSAQVETNLAGLVEPFCITSGSVPARERAGLGFALNQDDDGESLLYSPDVTEGFSFSIHNVAKANFTFQVGLVDEAGNIYCAQTTTSEREELVTREFFFEDLTYCEGDQTRPSSFKALQIELLDAAPDARFCVGSFLHTYRAIE